MLEHTGRTEAEYFPIDQVPINVFMYHLKKKKTRVKGEDLLATKLVEREAKMAVMVQVNSSTFNIYLLTEE